MVSNILVSGGRLASSDELAAYLTTESLAKRGDLAIDPRLVKNGDYGRDGKFYYGAGIAQPVLCMPLYLAGDVVTNIIGLSEPMKTLALKASVSVFNQIFAGLMAVLMFVFSQKLGYSKRLSLFLTICLLFTTNLFPYFKSFMREPELAFYLLAAVYGLYCFKMERKSKYLVLAGVLSGVGLLTRLTFVISLLPLVGYLVLVVMVDPKKSVMDWADVVKMLALFLGPIVLAIGVNAWLNYVQFGDVSTMPYGKATFTTPLFVGVYGLLFSSGKSFFVYAPVTLLVFSSLSIFWKTNRTELLLFAMLFLFNLVFFAKFVAWAGDGSWGSRYLIPLLPFLILPLGRLLQSNGMAKRAAIALATIGFIIQVGGVAVYLGNYMREIGEYPYARSFDDPESLYKLHFIPNYSPVVGHWEMLVRNVQLHFTDQKPSFKLANTEERIPLSPEEAKNLKYTLDFWFMYLSYAGVQRTPIIIAVAVLFLSTLFLGYKTYHSILFPSSA